MPFLPRTQVITAFGALALALLVLELVRHALTRARALLRHEPDRRRGGRGDGEAP